jgi:hypothetical protein
MSSAMHRQLTSNHRSLTEVLANTDFTPYTCTKNPDETDPVNLSRLQAKFAHFSADYRRISRPTRSLEKHFEQWNGLLRSEAENGKDFEQKLFDTFIPTKKSLTSSKREMRRAGPHQNHLRNLNCRSRRQSQV